MASAVFVLDLSGRVIISRNYRGDIPMNAIERFMPLLAETEENEVAVAPVLTDNGITFLHLKHNNLYRMLLVGFIHIFCSISINEKKCKCRGYSHVFTSINTSFDGILSNFGRRKYSG